MPAPYVLADVPAIPAGVRQQQPSVIRTGTENMNQAASRVIMVRPHHFRPNPATAHDNGFGSSAAGATQEVSRRAYHEATRLAQQLQDAGVGVDLFEDTGHSTPDSVFPNNWLSTHRDGRLVLYPMYAPNRRAERRADLVAFLQESYAVNEVLDLSGAEQHGAYLEGTGAMVLDRAHRLAYACFSQRITSTLFFRWCREFMYEPVTFHAADSRGTAVYHTNVMLSIGEDLVLIGSELICSAHQRAAVLERLRSAGRTVLELSEEQIKSFGANVLQLSGADGPVLAISTTALRSLSPAQQRRLEAHGQILPARVPTIESAGGSVRCMLAENYLPAHAPSWRTGPRNDAETSTGYRALS